MRIIELNKDIQPEIKGPVIAIGNFDGVHKGHQEILKRVVEKARKENKPAGLLTFEPHPISFFSPEKKNYRITPFNSKKDIVKELGIDVFYIAKFDKEFSIITAEEFVSDLLVKKLKIDSVFTGEDFIFGYKREGNAEKMKAYAKQYGFEYITVEKVEGKAGRYSSSKVREYIRDGKLEDARQSLGRNYSIKGLVEHGAGKARELGFATANIKPGEYVIPKFGVYSCRVNVKDSNKTYDAIANIGVKPTYGDNMPLIEAHIFDFNENIYDKEIEVELLGFIREEKKFNSIEELKTQIKNDISSLKKNA